MQVHLYKLTAKELHVSLFIYDLVWVYSTKLFYLKFNCCFTKLQQQGLIFIERVYYEWATVLDEHSDPFSREIVLRLVDYIISQQSTRDDISMRIIFPE